MPSPDPAAPLRSPKIAFASPFASRGFGGSIWSRQVEVALASFGDVQALRLGGTSGPSGVLGRLVCQARTYGIDKWTLVRPWLRRQMDRGAEVFVIDSTVLGWMAPEIRSLRSSARILVFAHNVEAQYNAARQDVWWALGSARRLRSSQCERMAARCADTIVFLTSHDKRLFKRLYRPHARSIVVPMSLDSSLVARERAPGPGEHARPVLLFVGSAYFGNQQALDAVSRGLPADADLDILVAGDVSAALPPSPRIRALAYVERLANVYRGCTAAFVPVQVGGGMKVKIAEALGHGVPVIASPQSARGYERAIESGVVRVFRDWNDLVAIARQWHQRPLPPDRVRAVFDLHYSASSLPETLRKIVG
jgi:polysaccharide biosynthesis protein PslH